MAPTSGAPVEIRPATVADAHAIAQVHVASWKATYPGIVPQSYLDALEVALFAGRWQEWLTTQPGVLVYVAVTENFVCGFASGGPARAALHGYPGELYAIYLTPGFQARGIGKRLFWTVGEALHRAGFRGMYLWVLEQNPSLGFYKQMGGHLITSAEIELGGEILKEAAYGWPDLALATSQHQPSAELNR